jgi:hypothetical protein
MRALLVFVSLLGACATTVPEGPVIGSWGGEHVGLTLDGASGRLEYDCAAGTIAGPLIPARDGSFAATGTHTPGQGGPDRIDYAPPSYPARYTGTVDRETMTLRVSVPSRDLTLGPFRLRRDAEPRILRCL